MEHQDLFLLQQRPKVCPSNSDPLAMSGACASVASTAHRKDSTTISQVPDLRHYPAREEGERERPPQSHREAVLEMDKKGRCATQRSLLQRNWEHQSYVKNSKVKSIDIHSNGHGKKASKAASELFRWKSSSVPVRWSLPTIHRKDNVPHNTLWENIAETIKASKKNFF